MCARGGWSFKKLKNNKLTHMYLNNKSDLQGCSQALQIISVRA